MKKYFITVFFLVTFSILSIAQSSVTNEKTGIFCKAWGFLKYYHPLIASGNINWDSVFLNNISKVISTKTNAEFNKLLMAVLKDAGKVADTKPAMLPDSLNTLNKTNTKWITQSKILDYQVKKTLEFIYENKNQGDNKYVKIVYGTADFSGENKYENIGFPRTKFRLLFLARFWNIINYFAPYKYLVGEDWNNVLLRFIPKFISASDTISYYKTLSELAKSLHDGHAQLTISYQDDIVNGLVFGKYTVPFYCQVIDGTVIVRKIANDSLCFKANIQRGDIITGIDNETIAKQIQQKKRYISASNKTSEDHALGRFVLDGPTSLVQLTIKRGNKVFNTRIARILSSQNFQQNWRDIFNYEGNDSGYKKINSSTLLIYAAQIWNGNLDTLKYMIKQSQAVIFDVRNHPQNDAFFSIADPFLPEPKVINYSTIALPDFPGLFKWKPSAEIGHINNNAYAGKVVILADERTQSQGEYSCMVLQTIPRSITIGSQTAGADGVVTYIPMGGTLNISYSGYGIYYADKSQTQRTGIRIDIPVKKTIQSVANNKDEILEKALQYLVNNRISN